MATDPRSAFAVAAKHIAAEGDLPLIQDALKDVPHSEVVAWVRGLTPRMMFSLWEISPQFSLSTHDLVLGHEVAVYHGVQSTPLFRQFKLKIARHEDQVFGHFDLGVPSMFFGPGYFIAYDAGERENEVIFDRTRVPRVQHPALPPIRPNDVGLGAMVHGGVRDRVRRVSESVLLGATFKHGRDTHLRFALVMPPR